MDIETLTNHISRLGKAYFEDACKLVLTDVFGLNAINVDGKNDGGTDYIVFDDSGKKQSVAYQITTQKSAIKSKAYKDAKKSIEKLGVTRFFFMTTFILDETESRKIENDITLELKISTTCLGSRHIAGLIISQNLLNKFLSNTNYPLPRNHSIGYDYREMALHSYTLISDDAMVLKSGIYDDTILFLLSNSEPLDQDELANKVTEFLGLGETRRDDLEKRIGALFGKNKIKRTTEGKIELHQDSKKELDSRKSVYEIELKNLAAAQVDLLRNEYECDWSEDDSKKVAIWIANAYIAEQINNLKDVKASIVANPLFNTQKDGINKLSKYLKDTKKIDLKRIDDCVEKLLENASNHPLIAKISRASIYVALEGSNPISSAKALGANRWSDFNIMLEPTVAIPFMCSQLYKGKVNRFFDVTIKAVDKAQKLSARLFIPYFYINECAGHLLQARRYDTLTLDENELRYSTNAFVANYYALKSEGVKLPESFMDYLSSYSSAIRTERSDIKAWIRSIMTDIQSILARSNVEFIDVPFYKDDDCIDFEKEYSYHLNDLGIEKPTHLIKHDVFALQFTNDKIVKNAEHWILLTYDRSMISISKGNKYSGWITSPAKFLDLTETTKPLSDSQLISLVHSVATFSEKTLAASARIIDRAVRFASAEMQNWEFKNSIEQFKNEMVNSINLNKPDIYIEIDKKTDAFLKTQGIELNEIIESGDISAAN